MGNVFSTIAYRFRFRDFEPPPLGSALRFIDPVVAIRIKRTRIQTKSVKQLAPKASAALFATGLARSTPSAIRRIAKSRRIIRIRTIFRSDHAGCADCHDETHSHRAITRTNRQIGLGCLKITSLVRCKLLFGNFIQRPTISSTCRRRHYAVYLVYCSHFAGRAGDGGHSFPHASDRYMDNPVNSEFRCRVNFRRLGPF